MALDASAEELADCLLRDPSRPHRRRATLLSLKNADDPDAVEIRIARHDRDGILRGYIDVASGRCRPAFHRCRRAFLLMVVCAVAYIGIGGRIDRDALEGGQTADVSRRRATNEQGQNQKRGVVYTCGLSADNRGPQWSIPLAKALFPDYDGPVPLEAESGDAKQLRNKFQFSHNDVLVALLFKKCPLVKRPRRKNKIQTLVNPAQFPGKVLIYNMEKKISDFTISMDAGQYLIGPYPHSEADHSTQVYFAAIHFLTYPVAARSELLSPVRKTSHRKQFAAYVAARCIDHREEAARRLNNEIGTVHAGGACAGEHMCGNTSETWKCTREGRGTLQRVETLASEVEDATSAVEAGANANKLMLSSLWSNPGFFRDYRFALVMENAKEKKYITEKILNAYLGGAIPIYYGTEEVFNLFNRDSMVYYNVSDPKPAIAQIRYLEKNPVVYEEMASRPVLAEGAEKEYFSLSNDVGGGKLKINIRKMMGLCC